jgi:hypothetical protein
MDTLEIRRALDDEPTVWAFVPFSTWNRGPIGVWTSRNAAVGWIAKWEASGVLRRYVLNESMAETNLRFGVLRESPTSTRRSLELRGAESIDAEYFEDGMQLGRDGMYPCHCCGYLTVGDHPMGGTFFICPVCNWEDDFSRAGWAADTGSGPNACGLTEARENFEKIGVCQPGAHGRPPMPHEMPRQLRPLRSWDFEAGT